ncbi:HAD family hydrolase [Marinagarivorans algicola]|uniref:HAD family hydrolase n=1 Tax=Marinagarivorans algicola TaxID=1513270 RepID=UPI0006B4E97B|nr:HAD-IA family hydrolase [Marinagarivorans algicola]
MFVIFDWDGTVSDSTGKIVRCVQQAGRSLNLPTLAPAQIKEIIGLSLPKAVAELYPTLNNAGIQALAQAYSQHYVADCEVPGFYPGAREALEQLRDAGVALGIATGKSRQGLNRVLRQLRLEGFFNATRTADETASKPDPQMLNELLQEHRSIAEHAIMVGDTEFDMAMAQAINMPRIAVDYGAHAIDRLKNYDPILCVGNLLDMSRQLLSR